ncbi:hypothetical protein Q3G72_032925 [Acer saccharum]|nr:hypothetical protein Q3G72_032925 [Acer saccharum]
MMSDLEERERAAFASDPSVKALEEEERIAKQLKEEIERKRATMLAKKESPASSTPQRKTKQSGGGGAGLDKEKVLKVAATGGVCGSLSNTLLVLPLQPSVATEFPGARRSAETNRI